MIKDKILVIDDEASIRASLQGILEDEGYLVDTTDSGRDGLDLLRKHNFDLILLDILLPEMDGIEVLQKIKTMEENPQVVMISGHGTIETAVRATKLGAYDFLEKPLSLENVVVTIKNALKQKRLEEENLQLRENLRAEYHLMGKSRSIQRLRNEIKAVAPTNGRILISGENGTGKELVARLIHQMSQRKDKRFVEVNCAAIPDELMEIELLGHLKGYSIHADKDKKGKFILADRGTLFLDEIGDMSLKTQAKLVRVIEEQKFEPLGSTEPIGIDTRVISATSRNLRELISKGKFREDLFFRLNVIPLTIPPLRERTEDIPLLIDFFLEFFSAEYGKKQKAMSEEAMKAFLNYSWPGNVSELMNVMERFVIMVKEDYITSSHLSLLVETREIEHAPGLNNNQTLKEAKDKFERKFLHQALIRNNWDISRTASSLKVEEGFLKERIKALNITFID